MRRLPRHASVLALAALLAPALPACAGPGAFVWFNELPEEPRVPSSEYLIKAGDVLNVRVLGHEDMSVRVPVRPDGRVGLALIGEVDARGKRPGALRSELEARLKDYIVSPSVSVNVDDAKAMTIRVLGEVTKPGVFAVDTDADMADAIALSGGLTDFATRDRIFVVRSQPAPARIRFTYEAVSRNLSGAAGFPLHADDIVVVE